MVEINKNKFSQLITEPKKISIEETFAVKNIVKEYPYFQTARIIELIGLKKHNSIRFSKVLENCSLFSSERGVLRDIIEFNKFSSSKSDYKKEIEVLSSSKTKNSFIEWLKITKPISKELRTNNKSIIQNFLKSKPALSTTNKVSKNNLSDEFKLNKKEYMTETLAKLYFEQKKFKEAIKAYEILSLKYPEKISLFADQIKTIKGSLKNNK
jgi:hypothetical protein